MSRVRGPNSALTEFLRAQGINANEIRRRHELRREAAAEAEEEAEAASSAQIAEESSSVALIEGASTEDEDAEVTRIALAAARKRRGDFNTDDDGTAICGLCNSRFTITVYSKPALNSDTQFLCRLCSSKTSLHKSARRCADKGASNKKRKKVASELLNLRFLVPPSLQDLCISTAAEYIDSIEELGGLTANAFNKISRILSKNRRLSSRTMQLFLRADVKQLEFWDCSTITPEAFNLIPALCPNLEKLVLGMCGQLCGENLIRLASLKYLTELRLDGAFMIRKEAWLDFIDLKGPHLRSLTISSVYRIDSEVLALLVEICSNLEHLSLTRLCQLHNPTPFYMLSQLPKLTSLHLCELEPEAWSDDAIVQTLYMTGSQLEVLVIKGAEGAVSDRVIDAIAASCANLKTLELVGLTEITDEAVGNMFSQWISANSNTSLHTLSLERCHLVGDAAVRAGIEQSRATLVDLNINSLQGVKSSTIEKLAELPYLTKLDIGFIGKVNRREIYKLSTSKTLKQVFAFGNIRLSGMPLPTGMTLVGTM